MMIHNVILSMQESSLPAQQLSTESDSQLSLDPVALDISLKHESRPETEMAHDYVSSKDMHDQSDSVKDVQTGEVCAQSDSVSNVQTANPVKVETTDMCAQTCAQTGSVEDVQTSEVCAQSEVHNAEINYTSVNDVLMVSDDQVKVDMSMTVRYIVLK